MYFIKKIACLKMWLLVANIQNGCKVAKSSLQQVNCLQNLQQHKCNIKYVGVHNHLCAYLFVLLRSIISVWQHISEPNIKSIPTKYFIFVICMLIVMFTYLKVILKRQHFLASYNPTLIWLWNSFSNSWIKFWMRTTKSRNI